MAAQAPEVEWAGTDGLVSSSRTLRLILALAGVRAELDHRCPLDEATYERIVAAQRATLAEVASTMPGPLADETVRLHMAPLAGDATVAEVRVALSQLVGWLTGVFVGGAPLQVLIEEDERG